MTHAGANWAPRPAGHPDSAGQAEIGARLPFVGLRRAANNNKTIKLRQAGPICASKLERRARPVLRNARP